jgi:citrate synthase
MSTISTDRGKFWKTSISWVQPNKLVVRGYRLHELIGNISYGEMVYLIYRGELPDRKTGKLMDALLVAGCDHSITPPSVSAARLVASGGVGLQNAIASGINALGDYHGGAIEGAMELFYEGSSRMQKGKSAEDTAAEILHEYRTQKKRIPGFGHHYHTDDPRVRRLFQLAKDAGVDGKYVEFCRVIEKTMEKEFGRKFPTNIDGASAAIACELGFDSRMGKGLFAISRIVGISAHAYEQMTEGERIKSFPPDMIEYDGPGERDLPPERRSSKQ